MKIIFEEAQERDIDLLMMTLFSESTEFLQAFVNELHIDEHHISEIKIIEHSYKDNTGESDITVIVKDGNRRLGILIENKIDAPPQDRQANRYGQRGHNGIKEGKYDFFVIALIAPAEYLLADQQDYPNKVSYERIIELIQASHLFNKEYAISLLSRAIEKKANGYTMIPHEGATNYFNDYIATWKEHGFDRIGTLATKSGKKHPSSGGWVEFKTDIKGLKIYHKSDRGYIDLQFNKCEGKGAEIQSILKEVVEDIENYSIIDTGGSASIRIQKSPLISSVGLDGQRDAAIECMEAVVALTKLSRKFNRRRVEELLAQAQLKH